MNVTVTPVVVPVGRTRVPVIQNLGPEPVFVARGNADVTGTGIRLAVGDAFELPNELGVGGPDLYMATATGTSDVRVITVE